MAPNKKEEGEFVKALVKISDKLDSTLRCISAALMVGFFVVMLVQVILRNLFPAHTLSWADGACRYLFIWATFLGAPLATKRRSQITISFIVDRFHGKAHKVIEGIMSILTTVIFVLLLLWGINGVRVTIPQTADAMNFSAAWIYAAIPVGIALLIFQTVICAVEDLFSQEAPVFEKEDIE